jgi:hypothetical protein
MFWLGILVGAAIVMMVPPEYEDRLRLWIINQWQKFTKKG